MNNITKLYCSKIEDIFNKYSSRHKTDDKFSLETTLVDQEEPYQIDEIKNFLNKKSELYFPNYSVDIETRQFMESDNSKILRVTFKRI